MSLKKANLLVTSVGSLSRFDDINAADLFANELGSASNSRITFIKNNGQVIGDSELDFDEISIIDNHGDRSEVIDALKNGKGWSSRYSKTLNQELLYLRFKIMKMYIPILLEYLSQLLT